MADHLSNLNPAQRQAAESKAPAVLVLAGAGAGKTKTLTARLSRLVDEGVAPEQLLAITFTNKAAREMRERLPKNQGHSRTPFIATFHAFGVFVLRNEHERLGLSKNFTIFDRDESLSAVKKAMERIGLDPKQHEPRKILSIISKLKGKGLSTSDFIPKEKSFVEQSLSSLWPHYEETLSKAKALDFDDLLLKTKTLFAKNPDILERYQRFFPYVHIDEYQDTNGVQYEIVKMLVGKNGNIFAVGDIDQSIYSWRGADFENILRFEADFPNAEVVLLEENYRSTQNILDAANTIIKKNKRRREKNLFTKNGPGEKITLVSTLSEKHEADYVANKAKELIKQGINPEQIAVLYRANFQSRAIEEACLKNTVSYQVLGTRFFDRKEVKDLLAFIKASINRDDWVSLARAAGAVPRGIGKSTIAKIASGEFDILTGASKTKAIAFYNILDEIKNVAENKPAQEAIKVALEKSGLADLFKKSSEDLERLENLRELATLASRFDNRPSPEGILEFLSEAALESDQDSLLAKNPGIKLMTVHAAKGLEFDAVFIVGLEDGLFPHQGFGETDRDDEEERRLFYVALTRARKHVYLLNAAVRTIFGRQEITIPSEFIGDIDPELITCEIKDDDNDYGTGKSWLPDISF